MSVEIKIQYKEVEQALAALKAKTDGLTTSFPMNIGSENQLDSIHRLNKLGEEIQAILIRYQSLLVKAEVETKQAVESMRELDEKASVQFQLPSE